MSHQMSTFFSKNFLLIPYCCGFRSKPQQYLYFIFYFFFYVIYCCVWIKPQQNHAAISNYSTSVSKLDRMLANQVWINNHDTTEVNFQCEGDFDHSPALLTLYNHGRGGKRPFRYYTIMWKASPQYDQLVRQAWSTPIQGSNMFQVVQKLKKVKTVLKELNKNGFTEVQVEDLKAQKAMLEAQKQMQLHPGCRDLADKELEAVKVYKEKHGIYMSFLKQKVKLDWLRDGDENTSIFHQSLKARRIQNQIYSIQDEHGTWLNKPQDVIYAFLTYYHKLMGSNIDNRRPVIPQLVQAGPLLTEEHKNILNAPYTEEVVKSALFSIPGCKAPGPDGFGSYYYKDNWEVVQQDVIAAVMETLQSGRVLKELNNTTVTLVPKTRCPKSVTEYRPISCCNTLYKCLSKVICNRLRQILPDIIVENQGGFVHGRSIVHNIMVIQDLVKHYGRKNVQPGCLLKIDLQKAYDTVNWSFLQEMLLHLEFPAHFIQLVMHCVSTPMYSLMINGSLEGYFKAERGLRQGDPMSPLLFVICMEYLSRILYKLSELELFHFHPRCRDTQLTHFCFADDLILCCKGDYPSIMLLLQAFKLFSESSGLKANSSKSAIYTSGMQEREVIRITEASRFQRSTLPFRYLGVPICSRRITKAQCDIIIEKMTARIRLWSSRNLSYTTRSQLINSVLMSLYRYWAQVFILPKCVLSRRSYKNMQGLLMEWASFFS